MDKSIWTRRRRLKKRNDASLRRIAEGTRWWTRPRWHSRYRRSVGGLAVRAGGEQRAPTSNDARAPDSSRAAELRDQHAERRSVQGAEKGRRKMRREEA